MGKILLRRNSTAAAQPTAAQIEPGELAINTTDGRLFTELNNGTIVNLPVKSIAGQAITPASVQTSGTADGIKIQAGGTANSRVITLQPTTLGGNRTLTLPDATAELALTFNPLAVTGTSPFANQKRGTIRNNFDDPTTEEAALFHGQFYNQLRFRSPALQEESADGGTTWTTSTRMSVDALGNMMRGEGEGTSVNIIPAGSSTPLGYRLTWDNTVTGFVYWTFSHLYINCSTNGNLTTFKIEAFHNTNGWTEIFTGTASNWPGHVSIKHTVIPYYPANAGAYGKLRVTFTASTTTTPVTLYSMEWFGGYPNGKRNAESYDRSKNVTFPADIKGTRLTSTQATGTAPLTVSSTTVCTNLNADTVDGYHNTDFFRKDTNVWQTTADDKNRFYFAANSRTYYSSPDGYEFRDSGGTGKFFITNAGNVGVGNSAPPAPLSVGNAAIGASDGYISIGKNNNAGGARMMRVGLDANFNFTIGDWGNNNAAPGPWVGAIKFKYNTPADTLVTDSVGNVGIGTATPGSKLVVKGAGITTATSALNVTNLSDVSLLFVRNDGNVGIGTATPAYKIDTYLASTVKIGNKVSKCFSTSALFLANTDIYVGTLVTTNNGDAAAAKIKISAPGSGTWRDIDFVLRNAGGVNSAFNAAVSGGAGNINLTFKYVNRTAAANKTDIFISTGATGVSYTQFIQVDSPSAGPAWSSAPDKFVDDTGYSAVGATAINLDANCLVLSSAGNVGIGQASPSYKLEVNGSLAIGGTNAYTFNSNAWGHDKIVFRQDVNNKITSDSNGNWNWLVAGKNWTLSDVANVGIGILAPGSKLVVKGAGITTATSALNVTNLSDVSLLFVRNDGNVGIGQASPSYKLEVNGSFAATTKSFRIAHPTKPNHILEYGSLESPYHGVRLTGRGKVIGSSGQVVLPEYLKNLVHDDERVTIQLTNYRHGKLLYVSAIDLQHDAFFVACDISSETDLEFFWCLTAVRKDINEMVVERATEFGF